ncbi:MAG: type II toxin-antitoxin system HigB family toxin [Proteobacteria bacterium]|nr:type II toxin-antitoxin system HigB family toxin [Pseudomonadota bacterium]
MHIVKTRTLVEFGRRHAAADRALREWAVRTRRGQWRNMQDVLAAFANARPISDERIVFNIKGNDYRLIVAVLFAEPPRAQGHVWIKFVGTHAEYDAIDALTVDDY